MKAAAQAGQPRGALGIAGRRRDIAAPVQIEQPGKSGDPEAGEVFRLDFHDLAAWGRENRVGQARAGGADDRFGVREQANLVGHAHPVITRIGWPRLDTYSRRFRRRRLEPLGFKP